ncbi:MAG: two-component regulator propeller domain-containing protein [Gammaproteobacteria bacterium]|nr:two-component regulator propeller domain-containing protein [Gammaproteobacteria bacterium]
MENKDWRTYFPMHGLADYWVYSFVEQPGEGMWIGTWAGLSRLDYKTGEFKNYLKELVNEWVYGLAIDGKNRLWVGTEGGVNMFDGKQWAVWTHKDGLGAANSKNLAFSTNTGLGTRSRHDLSVLALGKETYNPNYVFCIQIDGGDKVWAGTWGGGASYFDGKSWKNYTTDDGLSGNIVYSMFISGDLHWFGTNHGLSAFDGDNWVSLTRADGLLDSHVYAVVQDSKGRVWAGTRNGVALIEKTR